MTPPTFNELRRRVDTSWGPTAKRPEDTFPASPRRPLIDALLQVGDAVVGAKPCHTKTAERHDP